MDSEARDMLGMMYWFFGIGLVGLGYIITLEHTISDERAYILGIFLGILFSQLAREARRVATSSDNGSAQSEEGK